MKRILIALVLIMLMIAPFSFSVTAQQHSHPTVRLELVTEGLTAPVDLDGVPDDSGRLFVVEQPGVIRVIDGDGHLMDEPFLDIRDRVEIPDEGYSEMGLLGLAFHPDYASNGRFFVFYTAPPGDSTPTDWVGRDRLSEFMVSADNPNLADPDSERILFEVDDPQSNHNGGDISFGPDGYLYIPIGDGGNRDDEGMGHTDEIGNAQDLTRHLGKILRIDVNNGDPYGIPSDNPFVDSDSALPEIWAWGLRNPWRATWDRETGQYFVADAGQEVWEEVSIVEGGNYGWRLHEGSHCFDPIYPEYNPLDCTDTGINGEPLQPPIIEHTHRVGLVVVGGYVYRGSALGDEFTGNYIFGDWSTSHSEPAGVLFIAHRPPADMEQPAMWKLHHLEVDGMEGHGIGEYLLAFGEDQQGELYVLTSDTPGPHSDTGKVWKIVPAEDHHEGEGEHGDDEASGNQVEVGLVEYAINMPTEIPAGTITFNVTNNGSVEHNFEVEGEGIEKEFEENLQPGDTRTMTVELEPGEYEIYCPVGNHADQGMRLTLTVTDASE